MPLIVPVLTEEPLLVSFSISPFLVLSKSLQDQSYFFSHITNLKGPHKRVSGRILRGRHVSLRNKNWH